MQSLLQSAFLQALGYSIFNSLWQMALLWVVVMIVNSVKKLSSSGKYYVGIVAQFAGFIWFLFTLRFYYVQCSEAITNAQLAGVADYSYYFYEPTVNNFSSGLMYVIIKTEQLLPYLSVAYLFMLLFLSVRLTRAYAYTQKIRKEGLLRPAAEWKLFVKKTAGYLGIQKDVILYFSELVKSPLTLGFIKPVILVPVASLNHLSTEQLEAILLHELAHIKRADYLINIIQSIIEVSLFFNPFMQLLGKFIKKERENSCDDWVLQFQYKPAMYAEALLRIAYIQTEPSFALQASGNKGELLPRVKRMLNQQENTHHYRNHVFAFMLITVMLTTVAWFNPSANKQIIHNSTGANTKKVMVEPFSAKVESPLYNPFFYLITRPLQEEIKAAVNNNISIDKLAEAIPNAKEVHDAVNKVTPIALGSSLREAYSNLEDELPFIGKDAEKAMQEAKIELNNLKIGDISITDSFKIASAISNLVQKELAKIDWSQVNTDLEKAKVDFVLAAGEKQDEYLTGSKINEALQQVAQQLKLLNKNTKNISFDTNAKGLINILQDKKKELIKIQQENQLQERIKQEKEKKKNRAAVVTALKPLRVWSDMKRDDYSFEIDESDLSGIASAECKMPAAAAPAPVYAAVAYNDNYADAAGTYINNSGKSDSAIIIILHNPENNKSHTKNITVQIAGNNGIAKTYTFTIDVYQ